MDKKDKIAEQNELANEVLQQTSRLKKLTNNLQKINSEVTNKLNEKILSGR